MWLEGLLCRGTVPIGHSYNGSNKKTISGRAKLDTATQVLWSHWCISLDARRDIREEPEKEPEENKAKRIRQQVYLLTALYT